MPHLMIQNRYQRHPSS